MDDADVLHCLRLLTFLPLEQIDEMDKWEGSQLNQAKEILAHELTALVHGEDEAQKAEAGAKALFTGGGDSEHIPTVELSEEDLTDGEIDIISLLLKAELVGTRNEGRRAITPNTCVTIDGEKIADIKYQVKKEALEGEGILVGKGKKVLQKSLRQIDKYAIIKVSLNRPRSCYERWPAQLDVERCAGHVHSAP